MKVIDLLNKIANGEEVPKEIVYNTRIFRYNEYNKCYIWNCNGDEFYLSTYYRLESILNDEVEIIEEDKEIEELPKYADVNEKTGLACGWSFQEEKLKDKINELIKEVNKLKKEGKQ